MFIVHESAPDRGLPEVIRIDCTGLEGHDLGGPEPWHVCLRSDRHGQNIYGPSLATIETTIHHSKKRPMHIVALGLTKAMHEFLTLHYFAIDSAASWDTLLAQKIPEATLYRMLMKDGKQLWTCLTSVTLLRLTGGCPRLNWRIETVVY